MPLGEMLKKRFRPGNKSSIPDVPKGPSGGAALPPGDSARSPRKRSVPLKDLEVQYKEQLDKMSDEIDDDVFVPLNSNLNLTLEDLLNNPSCGAVAYFVQYLEARDSSNLLKFWLDVEGFKASSQHPYRPPRSSRSSNSGVKEDPILDPRDFDSVSPIPPNTHDTCRDKSAKCSDSFDSGFADRSHIFHPLSSGSEVSDDSVADPSKFADIGEGCNSNKDALEIYQRYISPDCPYPLPLSKELTQSIVQGICTETGEVDKGCFDLAQTFIIKLLEIEYFPDFLRSEGYAKHQLDVITGGEIEMSDILCDDTLLFHFMEFMEGQGDRDLLEFWMTASNFRRNKDHEHLQKDAIVIYERFISMQATSFLGLSDPLRLRIESNICHEKGVTQDCFNPVLSLVSKILQVKYLNPFLNSNIFKKYLNELLCQIQTSPYVKADQSRRSRRKMDRSSSNTSLSTASDLSISAQNTLLAMSTQRSDVLDRNPKFSLETIDPDSIWKRKNHTMVNIGQVDNLGRYRSCYEHLPGSSKEDLSSKFSKAMRKLVTNDISKVQEEMAWQMAEMVIKDVMCNTQSANSSLRNKCDDTR